MYCIAIALLLLKHIYIYKAGTLYITVYLYCKKLLLRNA